mgnify:CR=1 FL=1
MGCTAYELRHETGEVVHDLYGTTESYGPSTYCAHDAAWDAGIDIKERYALMARQGVPLAVIQKLAHYWMTDYDWRTCEANLNALPQFITEIDGLDIHFIHVRSRHADAMPLVMTHGWPGSIFELLKLARGTYS